VKAWQAPARTPTAAAVYAAAEADREAHPERYRLDAATLVERALRGESERELGEPDWSEGLEVFLESAREDSRLNAVGLQMAAATVVGRLRARIATHRYFEARPDARSREIVAPIFIVGGWRTGTTFLQRLLAEDPRLHALRPWELGAPWKAAGANEEERARLAAGAQAAHDRLHLLNARLEQVHASGAALPEECVLAMGNDFRNWGFLSTMRLTRYADWLARQPFGGAYAHYRDVLRMLSEADGRRFLLKAPAHTAELASLLEVFPDAVVVHLHRDVVETVASGTSLFATFRSTYSDEVDGADVGGFQADQTVLWLERACALRDACAAEGRGTFVDVAYGDLVRHPLEVVRAILAAAGLDWSDALADALARHRAAHPRDRHGRHVYSAEEFGLDPEALRVRLAAYRARFGVT